MVTEQAWWVCLLCWDTTFQRFLQPSLFSWTELLTLSLSHHLAGHRALSHQNVFLTQCAKPSLSFLSALLPLSQTLPWQTQGKLKVMGEQKYFHPQFTSKISGIIQTVMSRALLDQKGCDKPGPLPLWTMLFSSGKYEVFFLFTYFRSIFTILTMRRVQNLFYFIQ